MSLWSRLKSRFHNPERAARIEAESRRWRIECKTCGQGSSVWDAGGVRYRAKGTKSSYGYCSNCEQNRWLKTFLPDDAKTE